MIQLQDPITHTIQEIAIMRYHDHGSFITIQIVFQPCEHLIIQMVGRLVQQQYIKILHQCPYKCCLSPLTTGKLCQQLLMIQNAQLIEHALCFTLQCPVHVPHTICHIGKYGFFFRKCWILLQVCDPDPVLCDHLPFIWLFQSSKHTQKCCLSGSVDTDHTDLLSFGNATGNVIKNHFSAKNLADMFYIDNIHKMPAPCLCLLYNYTKAKDALQ